MANGSDPAGDRHETGALQASFDYSLNGILEVAADGRVRQCNAAASSILGLPRRRINGASLEEVLSLREESRARWRRHAETVAEQGMGLVTLGIGRADGPRVIELATVDIGGGCRLHILDDITEQRNLTDSLEAARRAADEASAAKSAFLANMSHEIRTPLNGIIGIERLLRLTSLTGQQKEYLDDLRQAAQNLLALLGDVLDLSKIEAGHLELECRPFDLREFVATVAAACRPQAAEKSLRLEFAVDAGVPARLRGDPLRLAQAANNLLANAIKFTASGQVVLAASWEKAGGEGRLRIAVRDTGIGMSEAELARIFQPFEQADASITRRYGGTGLGLAIARGMVRRMGGDITVASSPGAGSEFVIEVPMAGAAGGESGPEASAMPGEGSVLDDLKGEYAGSRALVVEDDAINRRVIAGLLRHAGIEVATAENGRAACDALLAPGASPPQLILMDVHMPVLDGVSATRELRAAGLDTPVVALTADVSPAAREGCLAAGMNDWLSKPPDVNELEAVLTRWLPARRAPDERAAAAQPALADLGYTLPGVDTAAAMERFIGNRALFEQALVSFVRNRREDVERIASLVAAGDLAPLERLLHSLAGSSGMLGADAVYAVARELEESLGRQPPPDLRDAVRRLQAAFAEVAAGVNAHFP